jgi:hypothetical protein
MGATDFKAKFSEKEALKEKEIAECREIFYIRRILVGLFVMGICGVLCYRYSQLLIIMPIFRCDDCRILQLERQFDIYLWELNLN